MDTQEVLLDVVHISVAGRPFRTIVRLAVRSTVGFVGFATLTVTFFDIGPPGPVQLRVYVLVAVRFVSEMDWLVR